MLYLNNELLTSERIISYFEKNLDSFDETIPLNRPSKLSQLKNKLRSIFFTFLDKSIPDETVLTQLDMDERFAGYNPKLKQVLRIIFSLHDTDDKREALEKLKAIRDIDFRTNNASTKFDEYNSSVNYFKNPSSDVYALFTELAIACRYQIVFAEQNNTNDDQLAYRYAYQLMGILVDPNHSERLSFDKLSKDIYKFMNSSNDKDHPFHDVLQVKLHTLPPDHKINRTSWVEFIQNEGISALKFFNMAEAIEEQIEIKEQIRRAPKDMKEAKEMARLCRYKRAAEDSDFATLCYEHNVAEDRFNQCLNFIDNNWPKKTQDNVPDLTVKGEGIAEGLYWVKLPSTDKRGLILGDITDCCQSIGGDSEHCVKDAVSLNENGIYVLLKQRKKGNFKVTVDGQINEKDFQIIGQSYIWKSVSGNICLDSIECLNHSVSEDALRSILSDFSTQLLKDYIDIQYVTIGRGGKTPSDLFDKAEISEIMCEGTPYSDSRYQYCIASNPLTEVDVEKHFFHQWFNGYSPYSINYLIRYMGHPEARSLIKQLALSLPQQDFRNPVQQFFNQSVSILVSLQHVLPKEILQANYRKIMKHSAPENVVRAFYKLQETGLLSGENAHINSEKIVKHPNIMELSRALGIMVKMADNLTQTDFDRLIHHPELKHLADVLFVLKKVSLLVGEEGGKNLNEVMKLESLQGLSYSLQVLHKAGLLTGEHAQEHVHVMIHRDDSNTLGLLLDILDVAGLLKNEHQKANFDAIVHHSDPDSLYAAFEMCHARRLLSIPDMGQLYFNAILQHAYPKDLARGLMELRKADLLSNDANRNALIEHPDLKIVVDILGTFNQKGLFTPSDAQFIFDSIINDPQLVNLQAEINTLKKAKNVTKDTLNNALIAHNKNRTENLETKINNSEDSSERFKSFKSRLVNEEETKGLDYTPKL